MNIIQTISLIGEGILDGTSKRIDCPFCHRKNTFSIFKEHGTILWNCFSTHCAIKGRKKTQTSVADLKYRLEIQGNKEETYDVWELPSYFREIRTKPELEKYLAKYNALLPITDRFVNCYFDPILGRIVFIIQRNNKIYNATGKLLEKKLSKTILTPKWWNYNPKNKNIPFLVENGGDILIIAEDCISACAMSNYPFSGMALLGTNINDLCLSNAILGRYKKAIIMLDKDANKKTLELQKKLEPFMKSMAYLSETDPKNLPLEKIKELHGTFS